MQDNYQYQVKPLPRLPPLGDEGFAAIQVGANPPFSPDLSPATVASPFSNPDYPNPGGGSGGGGGVTPPLDCSDSIEVGNIQTGAVFFPCDTPTSSISEAGIALGDPQWLDISQGSVDPNSAVITLNELDVCYLGAPGKRQFVCGDAYAA